MTLTALAHDVQAAVGEAARFPASLMLKERAFLSALQAGDRDATRASGQVLRDAVVTLADGDRDRLRALNSSAGNRNEWAFLHARLEVLEEWLAIPRSFDGDDAEPAPDPQSPARAPQDSEHTGRRRRRAGPHGADRVMPPAFGHRDDIQGLRAVAVLLVALAHAGVTVLQGGFIGVDVFFVLSGFLITGLLLSEACTRCWVSLTDFYMRRARRILPAATLTLIVTDIAAYHLLNVVRAKQYLQDSIPSALFGANIHFAAIGTNYFATGQPPSPFQHFWSLAVEEQFYIVWPAVFIALLGLRLRRFAARPSAIHVRDLRRVLVAVVALTTVSVIWSARDTASHAAAAYFSTPARVWELGLGAALALGSYPLAELGPRLRAGIGWAGVLCIAAAAVGFSDATPFPGYAALLPTVGAALVIVAGLGGGSHRLSPGRMLGWRPLRFIGDRSYAFYLWHWPVLVIAAQRAGHPLALSVNLLLLIAAFALSVVSYALYERPLRFAALTRKPQSVLLWVGSVMTILVLASTWIASIDAKETTQAQAAQATAVPTLALAATPAASRRLSASSTPASTADATSAVLPAVTREVRLDTAGRALPASLDPPPTQLLTDLPPLPGQCGARAGQTSSALCRLGTAQSSHTLVLFGDSHAQVWLTDAEAVARSAGWALVPVTKVSCQPADWVSPLGAAECHPWFAWALRAIRGLHPSAVLIAGNYNWVAPAEDNDVSAGLSAVVAAMHRITPRVTIVGDVPQRDTQPVDCLLRPHATATSCSQALPAQGAALTGVVGQVAASDGAGFVDTTGWFCAEGECPLVVGNIVAYRDSTHVSQAYATALHAVFAAAVRATIPGLTRAGAGAQGAGSRRS